MSTYTTATGRTVDLRTRPGRCGQIVQRIPDGPYVPCSRSATEHYCAPGAGRAVVVACRCDAHGGDVEAIATTLRTWSVLAPDPVGGDYAVMEAGAAGLCSEHAIVVVRPEHGRWLAALGVGSHTTPVRATPCPQAKDADHRRQHGCSRRGGSYATADQAMAAAVEVWRIGLGRRVAEITAQRGGTLAWGVPVAPRTDPIRLVCKPGQSGYDALAACQPA